MEPRDVETLISIFDDEFQIHVCTCFVADPVVSHSWFSELRLGTLSQLKQLRRLYSPKSKPKNN